VGTAAVERSGTGGGEAGTAAVERSGTGGGEAGTGRIERAVGCGVEASAAEGIERMRTGGFAASETGGGTGMAG
jgi:hypothetical protein